LNNPQRESPSYLGENREVPEEYFIGLLSGTSIDSIDAAIFTFGGEDCQLIATHNHAIPPSLRSQLVQAAQCDQFGIDELGSLDAQFGELLAEAVQTLLASTDLPAERISAVGSHGQTIRHRPNLTPRFTWQIGDPTRIVERTGITTVADFRRRDMAAGGEGAPFAPLFHQFKFADPNESRAVINIGGIANITILPGDPAQQIVGFDCGPGNLLMDGWIEKHRSLPFDHHGEWGLSGKVDPGLLQHLLGIDYFELSPPKSTGRELFNMEWLARHLAGFSALRTEDVQATLLEFTAASIATSLLKQNPDCQRALVCGGGSHNKGLMKRLESLLGIPTESTVLHGLSPDWVEAATFAWFARRALRREPTGTPPITGASHSVVLGAIYPA